ncbi:uncharacterized protein LOC111400128 [Olea europaea var. sylvestris]|uniref:uncharacterized protein LOC111400128 n=1 Tax=Olea europaea var. sylvestris TaxID=158386 RepID=UPI000C1D09A8|nr:uncharacterized protein LOC111400128 [Olea europaea var. sylvestris]
MSQSLSVPPYFDGSNYAYWKVRMRAFLKSLDEHVWVSVQNGWKPPSTIVSGTVNLTDISLWTKDEIAECNWNSKGLHALFMAVSPEEFRRVSMCETAKEVWDILETIHEETKTVKNSKLQVLTSRFEEVRMKDDETFDEFYAKLNNIVNSSFNLGEKIPESKIVRKVLRSLPERFRPKVTAIEESKDLDEVKIEELVGSLQTYELTITQSKKGKFIALKSIKEDESSDTELLRDEKIAYFVKKFQRVLKNRRKPQNKKSGAPSRFTKAKTETFNNKGSSDKPRLVSDRQESSSSKDEGNYMAFVSTVKSESDKESDKVEENFQTIILKEKEKLASNLQNSLKSGSELKCVNKKLEDKIKTLTSELVKSNAHLQTFVSGTKKLDNILEMNKHAGDRKGLGYVEGNTHVAGPSKTVFVSASKKVNAVSSSNKGKNVPREQSHQSRRDFIPRYPQPRTFEPRFIPTCHHCGALGHTRPRCYRLGNERKNLNIPSQVSFLSNQVSHLTEMLTKLTRSTLSSKKVWVKKGDLARHSSQKKCFVAHVALKAQNYNMWYLDSACSRHMCGNKALFTTLDECNGGMITFGDGGSAPILGKGTVQIHDLPVISNVLYVESLKSNLLSISQICDADFEVSFVEKRCTVYDSPGGVVLEGHKRLGHLNYKSLVQLARKELVDGLLKIGPSENVVCGPCQLDKQLKGNHKKTSKILTKRPLELIHMDLMGPSRTESLGSKRYILVVVDDFSRFTWIELLREKSYACDLIKSLCKRLSNQLNLKVSRMRSDHGKEFENFNLKSFCMDEGILHEFSSPITPQQNGSVENCDKDGDLISSSDPTEPPVSESSLRKPETPEKKTFPQDRDKDPKEPSTRVEPKKVEEALSDECWVNAMHEELNQFARNNVWILVPRPENRNVIGTKWIF